MPHRTLGAEILVKSLKGHLLIAGGGLYDDNFRQTVVLVGAHDENGAVGVILNRPLEVAVGDAIPALAEIAGPGEALFGGGPVETDQPVLLIDSGDAGVLDVPVFGDVGFMTGDVSPEVRAVLRRARVFVGHAGWGPGQLDAEVAADAWIVESASVEDVFTTRPSSLWRRLLQRKGPPFDAMARMPFDPRMN
jgi:putative transcriptional regulator